MGGAIRAEVRKIFTTRLWWGLLLGLILVSGGVSALFASLVGTTVAGRNPASNPFLIMTEGTAQLIYAGGFVYNLTPLFPLALGVILITQEFRHQTISATFLARPRRVELLLAKVVAVVIIGVVYGIVHDLAAGGFGTLVLAIKGEPTFLGSSATWQTFAISLLTFVLWALLGFGFGLLVRNQLAAVFLALGIAFIAHIALSIVFSILNWTTPPKFLPDNLSVGMLVTHDPTGGAGGASPYFSLWVNAAVFLGYAVVLSGLGSWLLSRRDIS
ncbi:ABC transporter permease [Nocardioides mangrovicus]|uniref:ABC transporter permease n=1 Tax=Nocardioides mangrovicus TaxID=2478913 RepID=A0A3L8P7F8_9ACTN|nr:ABC transporter permease subunit [Nocardioides mangrovicus]RLV50318.1 ABC transporter permease [Nocardioides mangrovicus]